MELDLGAFPLVEDFIVKVEELESETALSYVVPSLDLVVNFPWWDKDASEMRGWGTSEIPCGSLEAPYWDQDQGWSLLIWQVDEQIYVMEGDGTEDYEEPQIYERWFTLPQQLYFSAWKDAIKGLQHDS